ncbi:MAG: choice-of-anchor D domain-containing protein, partial [Thermoflexales bacterium]|nr:choice-of-anchor D domain-containing protein [Thermoflexales bacterium]
EISFYVFSSDRVPPVVSNVQAVDVTPYSARITWDTDEACTSQVEHGLTGAYGTISPISSTRVTSHSLTLVGLDASTTYHFRVRSQDVAYNETVSGDGTFSTAALGNFHYVDQKHPSASDANSGTTVDDPWLTIQHAADVAQPGDIIVVYPGSYGRVTISAGGTPGHYITFRGLNVPDQGLVDPEVLFDPANPVPVPGNPVVNAVMRGFTLQPPYLITEPVSYVRIENLEITNISAAGYTGGRAVSMNNTAHVQLVNNFIHDVNPAAHGMGIVGSGHANIGNVIKGNTLYRVQGVGISISGRNWLVEDNDISHGIDANTYTGEYDGTDTDAIRFFGSGHVIRNNTMRDYLREEQLGVPHIDCFQTFSANPDGLQFAYDILVEGNSCDDFGQMLMIEDQAEAEGRGNLVHHVTLRNNVFRGARAATINGSCDYFTLVNNVVAESHYTAFMASNHPYLTVVNNIFYNNGAGSQIIDEDAKVGTVWDYNIYYPDFDWPTKQPGYDQHSLFGTGPGFVDPAAGDFRLRVDSPAIDAGIALTEFNYDRYATARPQGQAWDIGAHEVLVEGEITVSPMSLAFGDQDVDTGATAAQAVTIANDGTADLHVSGIDLAGADASAFIVQSGGGAVTLTQGSAHTVQVAFDPSTPGLKSAVLRVRSDDSDEDTVDVALSGTATAADAPTLGIVKTVTPMQAQPGQTITYTIAISNRGGGVATDVVMTDPLPVGVSFGRQLQGSLLLPVGDNVYQWGPYDVAAHTAYTIQFTSNVTDAVAFVGRTIANTAYFSAANHLPGASEGAPLIIGRRIYLPLVLRSP